MRARYIYTSVTRISDLEKQDFKVELVSRENWRSGDYILTEVDRRPGGRLGIELTNGRMVQAFKGDLLVGALGIRHATVEATGTWKEVGSDGRMHLMTAAGLMGKLTSKSEHVPVVVSLNYLGHLKRDGQSLNMQDFVPAQEYKEYNIPTIITIGTSMSSGKTTAAKILIRQLKKAGKKVLGAKLTGAARYRDILHMGDAGADYIFDFVDIGLPSSICSKELYSNSLETLLSMMAYTDVDLAVIEIGASPLEPYNGDTAFNRIQKHIKCVILCASDPYAVLGVMKAFRLKPDIVSGIAVNTKAGIELVHKLVGIPAINIIDPATRPAFNKIVFEKIGILKEVMKESNHLVH